MNPTFFDLLTKLRKDTRNVQSQLRQGLSDGQLRGEELLSVSEFVWDLLGDDMFEPTELVRAGKARRDALREPPKVPPLETVTTGGVSATFETEKDLDGQIDDILDGTVKPSTDPYYPDGIVQMSQENLSYWVRKLYNSVSSQSGAIARLQKQIAALLPASETINVDLPTPQPKETDPIIGIEMATGKPVRAARPDNRSIADRELAMWKSYTVFPPKMGSTIDLLYANADGLQMELAALAEEGLDSHGNAVYWRDHDEYKP